jgi:hypothetical protein
MISSSGSPDAEAGPASLTEAPGAGTLPAEQRVKKPGELWRIEGSLTAVRAEIAQLESLDDAGLRARVGELERRWRAELAAVLPDSVLGELRELFEWADDVPADPSELRIGLAQLSGWLDGLISGLDVLVREPSE